MKKNQRLFFSLLFCSSLCFYNSVSLANESDELTIDVEHYEVLGETHLTELELADLLKPFKGKGKTVDDIQQAANALQNKLRAMGYGFYQVDLAAQTLDSHQVKLTVEPLVIDKIFVNQAETEAQFFTQKNIINSVPSLKKGQSPNLHDVTSELEIANLNPAKNVNIQFSMSEKPEHIDADIIVAEQNPATVFSWFNNTGSQDTGDYRLGIGYKNHNLFDKDHQLSVTFTTSPDHLKEVQQYGIDYRIPFYQYRGILKLYGYYSDVDSGTVAGGFDVSGKGTFLGAQYEWYLPKMSGYNKYAHHLVFGLDDKLFNNNVFFLKEPIGTDVRSTPLSIAYHGKWRDLSSDLKFYLKYDHNLKVGTNNNDKDYALSRYNASPNWDAFRLGINYQWLIQSYRLASKINAQYTDQELISGEQLGIGGITGNVRGFNERELIGDRGVSASIELWSPALWNNQMNLLAFTDAGYAQRINPLPDEVHSDSILSAGVGAVWRWKNYIDLTVYVAHVLNGNETLSEDATENGDNKIQFNLFMRY